MLKPLLPNFCEVPGESTPLRAGSLVETSVWPGSALDSLVSEAGYGLNFSDSFVKYDRDSRSWKTSQLYLFPSTSEPLHQFLEYSGTWPRSGMTRNGTCFRLPCSEPPIKGRGFLSLPTPTHMEYKDIGIASLLARLDRGGRVARRLCREGIRLGKISPSDRVKVAPSFLETMMGFSPGWTDIGSIALVLAETPSAQPLLDMSGQE
jgi:hypothetical protein